MHLISNMLFLWVFADNVEDAFGHVGFLDLLSDLRASPARMLHTLIQPTSPAPLIGASAAVSGVLASYLLLYPKARVWILLFMRIPLRISGLLGFGRLVRCCSLSALSSPLEDDVRGRLVGAYWRVPRRPHLDLRAALAPSGRRSFQATLRQPSVAGGIALPVSELTRGLCGL